MHQFVKNWNWNFISDTCDIFRTNTEPLTLLWICCFTREWVSASQNNKPLASSVIHSSFWLACSTWCSGLTAKFRNKLQVIAKWHYSVFTECISLNSSVGSDELHTIFNLFVLDNILFVPNRTDSVYPNILKGLWATLTHPNSLLRSQFHRYLSQRPVMQNHRHTTEAYTSLQLTYDLYIVCKE